MINNSFPKRKRIKSYLSIKMRVHLMYFDMMEIV